MLRVLSPIGVKQLEQITLANNQKKLLDVSQLRKTILEKQKQFTTSEINRIQLKVRLGEEKH